MSNNTSNFVEKELYTTISECNYIKNEKYSKSQDKFLVATTENNMINCVYGNVTPQVKKWIASFNNNFEAKEDLYILAVDNLLKKVEYLNLTMQLDQELITEEEFEEELTENEENYLIHTSPNFNMHDFDIILSITHRLRKRNFTSDEISEMFSIDLDKVEQFIEYYHKRNIL